MTAWWHCLTSPIAFTSEKARRGPFDSEPPLYYKEPIRTGLWSKFMRGAVLHGFGNSCGDCAALT